MLYTQKLRTLANDTPDALAVWMPEGTRTYAELISRSEQIAGALQAVGCVPGDRVMLISGSNLDAVDISIASILIRCIPTPMATSAHPDTIGALKADSRPRVVFVEEKHIGLLETSHIDDTRVVVIDGQGVDAMSRWLYENEQAIEYSEAEPEDILTIIYTSGTTSIPKGMAHTNNARTAFWTFQGKIGDGMLNGAKYGLTTAFYTSGTFQSLLATIYNGGTAVMLPSFDPEQFLSMVEEGKINSAFLVPLQIRRILDADGFSSDRISNFRFAMVSGSACDQTTKQRIIDHWPGMLIDAYGSSEVPLLAYDDMKCRNRRPGSVGQILDYAEVIILDDNGQSLPVGETGEIVARTPHMMKGYFNRDDLTAEIEWRDSEGTLYLSTGDVGYLDKDGYLYITDRKKDMIVSGGMNIFPADIEAVFGERKDIAEAAVIAIPSEHWGETPYAILVKYPGAVVDEEELLNWVNQRLDRKARVSGLEFRTTLIRNDMGKISKKDLREPFWQAYSVRVR